MFSVNVPLAPPEPHARDATCAARVGRDSQCVARVVGEHGVDIDIVLAGSFPGDGKPKPVVFPDPAVAAERGARVALLPLPRLIELKLASGMTAPHRLRDLADVIELVRAVGLPADLAAELAPYVLEKYLELWRAEQFEDPQ